jgi:hypothetical protein
MGMMRKVVSVTTDGSGDATAYTPPVNGEIESITYVKPGAGSYTDGVDFALTNEATGEVIWTGTNVNATVTVKPRKAVVTELQAAALYAAGGVAVLDKISIARARIKIVIAAGGATKTGAFHFNIKN